jgi:cytoskeletal protein RodZ
MTRETILTQQEQVHRLMQIGAYLHQVREDQALSLEEVAARTLIQPRLLRAIESGEIHHLPEPVYIQGFIKRYADSLGLDGTDCADAFPTEKILRIPQQDSWNDSPAAQLRPLHLYVAYVALIMASVSLLSFIVGRSAGTSLPISRTAGQNQTEPGQITQVQAAQQPAIGSQEKATIGLSSNLTQPIAARPQATDKPIQVDMKLTAQSWLEVEVDGDIKLAEVLPEGTERTWAANKQVRIRAGNAGGVMVAYNGGQSQPMGAPGAVEEKTFSPGQSTASLPKPEAQTQAQTQAQP